MRELRITRLHRPFAVSHAPSAFAITRLRPTWYSAIHGFATAEGRVREPVGRAGVSSARHDRERSIDPSEMTADKRFEVTAEPAAEDLSFLGSRLYAFNVASTGIDDGVLLGIFLRDANGEIVAGLNGHTWGGTCEIDRVWVIDERRRHGTGTKLLQAAEEESRRRGCRQIVLRTHSFQAAPFYERLGFEEVGRYTDYPRGYDDIFLRKTLS